MDSHEKFEADFRHYAYNDNGERVHVCRDEGPIEREDYICIACGKTMRAIILSRLQITSHSRNLFPIKTKKAV